MKSLAANLTVLIAVSLITLIIGELLVRQFTPLKQKGRSFPQKYFIKDDINGFDIIANTRGKTHQLADGISFEIWSNSLGCFDDELNSDNYTLALGDSFTWGFVATENRWTNKLAKLTNQRILNCAVIGTGIQSQLAKAKKIIKIAGKKPKRMIVTSFLGNDLLDDYLYPQRTVIEGRLVNQKFINKETGEVIFKSLPDLEKKVKKRLKLNAEQLRLANENWIYRIKPWLRKNSSIYQQVSNIKQLRLLLSQLEGNSSELSGKKNNSKNKPGQVSHMIPGRDLILEDAEWANMAWDIHLQAFADLKTFSDANNIDLVIVLIPFREQIYLPKKQPIKGDILRANKKLTQFMELKNISYIDLYDNFKNIASQSQEPQINQNRLYYKKDKHWTKKGHSLATKVIHDFLQTRPDQASVER